MSNYRRSQKSVNVYQPLEQRRLLAGDVVAVNVGDSLNIFGDNSSNEILISVTSDGDVSVAGQNGTTINGTDDPFIVDIDGALLDDLRIFLAGGDDTVFIEDISIEDNVLIRGGAGHENIGILDSSIQHNLFIDSGVGDDEVSVDIVEVGGNLTVKTRGGEDAFGLDQSTISGRTSIDTGGRSDRIALRESIHNSRVRINAGGGADFVSADQLDVNDVARISAGGRSDSIFVNNSDFISRVIAQGAGGNDLLEVTGGTSFAVQPRVTSFEGNDVVGGLPQTDQVFADLIDSGARLGTIVEIAAMTPDLSALVAAVQTTGLDSALNGSGPFTVFAPLNSAFAAIANVVGGLTNDQLTNVLQFHVVADEVFASELVTLSSVDTLLGQSFTVDTSNGVVLNGNATLAATDIRAKNGVIHLLNDVLIPTL